MDVIKRQLLPDIVDHLAKPEITLIVGARQVGKTTLMQHVNDILLKQGEKTLFLNHVITIYKIMFYSITGLH